jgi:hypothetical protein
MEKLSETAAAETPEPAVARAAPDSWWQSLLALVKTAAPALQFSLAAAALAVALGGAWLIAETARLRSRVEQLQAERVAQGQEWQQEVAAERARRAELEQELAKRQGQLVQEAAKQPPALGLAPPQLAQRGAQRPRPGFFALVLTPGLSRDPEEPGGGPKRVRIPPGAAWLRLQLEIRRAGNYPSYRAALQTAEGDEIWSQSLLRAKTTGSGRTVALNLPAGLFTRGDYLLTLTGVTADQASEEVGDYYFSVVNK